MLETESGKAYISNPPPLLFLGKEKWEYIYS